MLSHDDPTVRVMLIGNRVPPNIQKSLDHHGIAWKEFSDHELKEFIENKKDKEFIHLFEDEQKNVPGTNKKKKPANKKQSYTIDQVTKHDSLVKSPRLSLRGVQRRSNL